MAVHLQQNVSLASLQPHEAMQNSLGSTMGKYQKGASDLGRVLGLHALGRWRRSDAEVERNRRFFVVNLKAQ